MIPLPYDYRVADSGSMNRSSEPSNCSARKRRATASSFRVGVTPSCATRIEATVQYDNYEGHWGEQAHLDRLIQMYAVEKSALEARRQGHTVTEQPLADGSIKLTIQVGSEA